MGDKQLTAVAYSYGTQIAALYAERFPYNVRSIVLDGVVDIDDLEDNFTWQLKQAQSYQETFDRFASGVRVQKVARFLQTEIRQ